MACKLTITLDDSWNVGIAIEPAVPIVAALGALDAARALLMKPLLASEQAQVVRAPAGALRQLPPRAEPGAN